VEHGVFVDFRYTNIVFQSEVFVVERPIVGCGEDSDILRCFIGMYDGGVGDGAVKVLVAERSDLVS
jgi:hypothetical protein